MGDAHRSCFLHPYFHSPHSNSMVTLHKTYGPGVLWSEVDQ